MKTIDNVRDFFKMLMQEEGVNLHPDDNFRDYINRESGLPSFTPEKADEYNAKMDKAFQICEPYGEDKIYELAIEVAEEVWDLEWDHNEYDDEGLPLNLPSC